MIISEENKKWIVQKFTRNIMTRDPRHERMEQIFIIYQLLGGMRSKYKCYDDPLYVEIINTLKEAGCNVDGI